MGPAARILRPYAGWLGAWLLCACPPEQRPLPGNEVMGTFELAAVPTGEATCELLDAPE